MSKKIIMYTDGGSRNNPGPAAVGVYLETLGKQFGNFIGNRTNNEAEYEAVVFGLNKIKQLVGKEESKETEIDCYLDSELVERQLNHRYKIKEDRIQKLFISVWNLSLDFKSVCFFHVPREKNSIADRMVNEALDEYERQNRLI